MTVNHLAIETTDVLRAQDFYCRYFGFRKASESGPDGFLTNDAGFVLVLEAVKEPSGPPGVFHFGFFLPSTGEVRRLFEAMKSGGVRFEQELVEGTNRGGQGTVIFFCLDPDGHKIEVRA
jgi:catechol 2,3-dioxygenase-like lactoylglutathione lyase family enzyme